VHFGTLQLHDLSRDLAIGGIQRRELGRRREVALSDALGE
jgi:hypothetical protein